MRLVLAALAVVAALVSEVRAQAPVDALAPFVGVWDTEDTYYPEFGEPLVERGRRTCSAALGGAYLHCETIATNARGEERTYWWLINRNPAMGRYEMVSLWSNLPFKVVHELHPDRDAARWQMRGLTTIGDDDPNRHHSELVFQGTDRVVWTGRRVTDGVDPGQAPISFTEVWTRRSSAPGHR